MRVKVLWQQHEHVAIESKIDMESGLFHSLYHICFDYYYKILLFFISEINYGSEELKVAATVSGQIWVWRQ